MALLLASPSLRREPASLSVYPATVYAPVSTLTLSVVSFGRAVPLECAGETVVPICPNGKVSANTPLLLGYEGDCSALIDRLAPRYAVPPSPPEGREVRQALLSLRTAPTEAARQTADAYLRRLLSPPPVYDYAALHRELRECLPLAQTLCAPTDGWFYGSCDGYEGALDTPDPAVLTPSLWEALLQTPATSPAPGKLYTSPELWLAALCTADLAHRLSVGETYLFPFSTGPLSATLIRLPAEGDRVLLLFRACTFPSLLPPRTSTVTLVLSAPPSLRVPACAVRHEGDATFVYALVGERVMARGIAVREEDGVWAYVEPVSSAVIEGETLRPLREMEAVVYEGADLYHRKIIS